MTDEGAVLVGLGDAEQRELTALRRRAYGPSPDLDDAEEQRLRDLEDRRVGPVGSRRPAGPPAPIDPSPSGAQVSDDSSATDGRAVPPRGGRLRAIGTTVGVATAAVVLVAVGAALARPPAFLDAGALAAVPIDPARAEVVVGAAAFGIRDLDPDTLVQYESLGQGTLWSAVDDTGGRCLILTVTDDSLELIANAGVWDVECAPAGLAPIIDWAVDPSYPSPPQSFADGGVVRLTLDGDRVVMTAGTPR